MALESLRLRALRSSLTVMGIFIGVVLIIAVASTLNGFRNRVVEQIEQFGTNTIFISKDPALRMRRPNSKFRKRADLTREDARAIREKCPAVEAISPMRKYQNWRLTARHAERETIAIHIVGAYPQITKIYTNGLRSGRFFTEVENQRRVRVCVIGIHIANTLFPNVTAVGKTIIVEKTPLRVIGVLNQFKDNPLGEENLDDSKVLVPYFTSFQMFPQKRSNFLLALAIPGKRTLAVEQIEEVLRQRRHVSWHDENDFEIATSDSLITTFDKITGATIGVMFALSTVAFLVGGVGVMNVMFASVKERTREIGVRRALGARQRDICWQFLIEAMVLTGVGGLLGVLVGEALMTGLQIFLPTLPAQTPMWARVFGFCGSVGVGLFFGFLPALQAARLDPIRALRYE